jgi:hypothetical protein
MRRITEVQSRSIRGIRLYLDDYYELVEIFERGNELRLEIRADEYELDGPDEITEVRRAAVRKLDLGFGFGQAMSLTITGDEAWIRFPSAPDPDYRRALEVLEFLRRRRSFGRRFVGMLSSPTAILVSFGLGTVVVPILRSGTRGLRVVQRQHVVCCGRDCEQLRRETLSRFPAVGG